MDAVIRPAGLADLPALSRLARLTYATAYGHSLTPQQLAAQLEHTRSEAFFRRALATDTILVADLDGDLAGYVHLADVHLDIPAATPRDQALNALYIHPDHQGCGIGHALVTAALAHPRFHDAGKIYLDVWDQNTRAIAFYERHGFSVCGEVDVVADGEFIGRDLVMVRPGGGGLS